MSVTRNPVEEQSVPSLHRSSDPLDGSPRRRGRRWGGRVAMSALFLSMALGCGSLMGGGSPDEAILEARSHIDQGDLEGAASAFATLREQYPDSVDVAVGHSFMQVLAGDLAGADATLAAVEATASAEELQRVKLRRSLVALREQELDRIKMHGIASGLPEGKLLAAEVHLVDLEREEGAA